MMMKILIIDDDDDCRNLLLHMLASQFQEFEAVEYDPLSQGVPGKNFNWSNFDVLLLDYDLRLDGVTGLDILQDNYDNPLFPTTIMLTGAGNEEIKVRALQSGVADYLRKDQVKMQEFKAAIDKAFAQQSSKRQHLYTLNNDKDKVIIRYILEHRDIGIIISDLRRDPDKIREWHCQIVLSIPINGQIEDKILDTQVFIADSSSHVLSQAKNRAKQEVDSILDIGL
ncbi:MAG: response regulator [Proteobacteria bacterium]|nr:response regulator [Pseudomonadota bacterium]